MENNVTVTLPSTSTIFNYGYIPKRIKRITRTIEKYDENGIFIGREVIIEEYEDVEKMVYEPPSYPYCPPPYQPPWYDPMWVSCSGYASGGSLCIN
jgi:hypothetical protein